VTATRDSLVTTKTDGRVAIWVSDGSEGNPKEIVPAILSSETADDVTWAADRVVFTSTIGGHRSISSVGPGGATSQEVVSQGSSPTSTSDGRTVVFRSSALRFLPLQTADGGRRIEWTPDSKGFLYVTGTPHNLWVESLAGKPPRQLTHFTDDRQIADAAWSRDGTRLAIARTTQTADIVLVRGLKR
jgi:Tol biopolymer transport system component